MLNIVKDYYELSKAAAEVVKGTLSHKPDAVLGLPTGSTPIGMYNELIRMYRADEIDFSGVTTFNLDEYYGMPYENKESYHYYMQRNFFDHVNINPDSINIPDGNAKDIAEECRKYDERIRKCGGIDLLILGIGHNGHIGFNEPGSEMIMDTHLTDLTAETILANSRFFEGTDDIPRKAVTMGLDGIMSARQIMLLASGADKAAAVRRLLSGDRVNPGFPASFLYLHSNTLMIINEDSMKAPGEIAGSISEKQGRVKAARGLMI